MRKPERHIMKIVIKHISNCKEKEIISFSKLLIKYNSLQYPEKVRNRVYNQAIYLGFVYSENQLIGIGAIKKPVNSYKEKISKNTLYDISDFNSEIGWLVVDPKYRNTKVASKIFYGLSKKINGLCFATTNNKRVEHLLWKTGFMPVGKEYNGINKGLKLYIRF
jgi:hypothetical protein